MLFATFLSVLKLSRAYSGFIRHGVSIWKFIWGALCPISELYDAADSQSQLECISLPVGLVRHGSECCIDNDRVDSPTSPRGTTLWAKELSIQHVTAMPY